MSTETEPTAAPTETSAEEAAMEIAVRLTPSLQGNCGVEVMDREEIARAIATALAAKDAQLAELKAELVVERKDRDGYFEQMTLLRKGVDQLTTELEREKAARVAAEEWQRNVSSAINSLPEFVNGQWGGDKMGWGFHSEFINWLKREREQLKSDLDAAVQRAEQAEATLGKVKRCAEIAGRLNDEQTDMEAAVTSSFNEAMAYDVLKQTEKERDSLAAQLGSVKAALGEHPESEADIAERVAQVRNHGRAHFIDATRLRVELETLKRELAEARSK